MPSLPDKNLKLGDAEITLTPAQVERYDRAYEISKECVDELEINDLQTMDPQGIEEGKSYSFKIVDDTSVEIWLLLWTRFAHHVKIRFSLSLIAYETLWLFESLTNDEEIEKIISDKPFNEIRRRGLTTLQLFDIEPEDLTASQAEHTKQVLIMILKNLGNFGESAIVDAVGHSKIGYYTHHMAPRLREHWKSLGLPRDFSLFSKEDIEHIRKHDVDWKRWFVGDKKQLLDMKSLPMQAEQLRHEFSTARKAAKKFEEAWRLVNPRNSRALATELKAHIRDKHQMFSANLIEEMLDNPETPPFKLAVSQLAEAYGYTPETMTKKISDARKLARKNRE